MACLVFALGSYAFEVARRAAGEDAYVHVRRRLGRSILLGLELLVTTTAAEPTDSAMVNGRVGTVANR